MVRLREVFPHGPGFVLVFDYMLSDLAEVVRNSEKPLTEVHVRTTPWYIIISKPLRLLCVGEWCWRVFKCLCVSSFSNSLSCALWCSIKVIVRG